MASTQEGKAYDGYTQKRWSYDVLYYPMTRTFHIKKGEFVLHKTEVELGDYPEEIRDVVIQYLSLRVLDVLKYSRSALISILHSNWAL
ncbi:MAG TPA: hypothetical protein GXX26_09290 [Clostridiaceae bacterium]|nr:hypothetical protein [Clostridiaceae bacterium]